MASGFLVSGPRLYYWCCAAVMFRLSIPPALHDGECGHAHANTEYKWVGAPPDLQPRDELQRQMTELCTPPSWAAAGEPPPLGIAGRREEQWHIGKLGGVAVAVAKTMEFTVTNVDGSREVCLGLGGVSVEPTYQRRGCGRAVVRAAFKRADESGKRMLFQTGDALPLCE